MMIEFDEMGFAPTTICPNPEQYATEWRERVRKEFARLTAENDNLTVELEVAQRDVENLTRTLDESNDEIKALESENAELRATLSKMETVEKELRERLDKAVELPYTEKGKEYTKIVYKNEFGDIDDETYFHDCYYGYKNDMRGDKYAEARLTELKGGRE